MQKKSSNFLKKELEKFKDLKMIDGYIFLDLNKLEEEEESYPN